MTTAHPFHRHSAAPARSRWVCFLLIVTACLGLCASPVNANRAVRAGIYNFKPLVYVDAHGAAQGIYVSVLEHVAKKHGWDIEYVFGTWQESLDRLKEDKIDLLLCIGYTEKRDVFLDFSKEYLLLDWGLVYKRKDVTINSIFDLDGRKVSALKGSVYTAGFENLVNQFSINVDIIQVDQMTDVFKQVSTGMTEAGVTANILGIMNETGYNVQRTPIIFTPVKLSYGVNGGKNADLLAALDQEIRALKEDRTSFYHGELAQAFGEKEKSIPQWVYWSGLSVLAALIVFSGFIGLLRRQVKKKTQALNATNEALNAQKDLLASIINGTTDAVFIKDTQGRYTVVNNEVEKLFALPWSDIIGYDDTRFFPPEDAQTIRSNDQAILDAGQVITREEYITLLGEKKYYLATKGPVHDNSGRVIGLFGISRDITELKKVQEEKKKTEAQLQHSQKIESIGTLAGGVAHEINNPINGIMNYAQLILEESETQGQVHEFAGEIIQETERVSNIVRNLLTFARQDKESHSPARLKDIIENTLSLIRTVFKRDQISLEIAVSEDLPQIKCRSQQIQQVIMNLVTNSRDALNAKYPNFDANKKILISSTLYRKEGRRWIRTTVEDRGDGIEASVMAKMFEPFFTTKPREAGTGLGLSISYGIVTDHHGELTCETRVGQYTKFHMDLPVDNGWGVRNE